jgi:acetyl esterase/lipase
MSGRKLNILITGDSAGASVAANVVFKIIEHNENPANRVTILPQPIALVFNYAALDFNFTSWMTPDNLRVLRTEESSGSLPGLKELAAQKDHLKHIVSPFVGYASSGFVLMIGSAESFEYGGRQATWGAPSEAA